MRYSSNSGGSSDFHILDAVCIDYVMKVKVAGLAKVFRCPVTG